jgi:hypothetical protein
MPFSVYRRFVPACGWVVLRGVGNSNRYAERFVAAEGIPALGCILDLVRLPTPVLRFTIAALRLLTQSLGAVACEVMLDWWSPPSIDAFEVHLLFLLDRVISGTQLRSCHVTLKFAAGKIAVTVHLSRDL